MNVRTLIRLIFLLFISLKLTASDTISLSLATLKGESNYEVWQTSTALKSKLIFPIDATLLHLGYQKQITSNLSLALHYQTKLEAHDTKGEDYDWQYKDLTVYSYARNSLKNYHDIKLSSTYKTDLFDYTFSTIYKYLQFSWTDTSQYDFIQDKQFLMLDKSISYEQDFLLLSFSPEYNYMVQNIQFFLNPTLYYGFNFSKDNHLKRDFYTKTKYSGLGYGFSSGINYNISSSLSISFKYHTFYFKDTHSQMDYATSKDFKYLSLPSSMSYKENRIILGFKYKL